MNDYLSLVVAVIVGGVVTEALVRRLWPRPEQRLVEAVRVSAKPGDLVVLRFNGDIELPAIHQAVAWFRSHIPDSVRLGAVRTDVSIEVIEFEETEDTETPTEELS